MSDMKKTLIKNLSEVMAEVGYIQKDGKNVQQKYRYASAEAVLKKVNSELSMRGIAISSEASLEHFSVTQYETDRGPRFRTDAAVRLTLRFLDGEDFVEVQGLGQSTDNGDKAVMKANTAAIKYCLTNAFLISWGDDPEADPAGDPPKSTPAKKPAATKKQPTRF